VVTCPAASSAAPARDEVGTSSCCYTTLPPPGLSTVAALVEACSRVVIIKIKASQHPATSIDVVGSTLKACQRRIQKQSMCMPVTMSVVQCLKSDALRMVQHGWKGWQPMQTTVAPVVGETGKKV
jgi:hypothetical protein